MLHVVVLNADWARGHNRELLAEDCRNADVLLVCEAKDIDLAKLLPAGWATMQDTTSQAKAGSAVCWRTATVLPGDRGLYLGTKAGKNVMARYIAYADLTERSTRREERFYAVHSPLKKTELQDDYYLALGNVLDAHPGVVGGDYNRPPEGAGRALGLAAHGQEVIGLLTPPSVRVRNESYIESPFTDHPIGHFLIELLKEKPVRGLCPFATHKLIAPGANDPAIKPRVAILHVDAGNNESLHDYFDGPSGGIESHFHIRRDGIIEQYRNIFWEADANYKANPFAVSIETQGYGDGEWTPEQLASIKRLLTWLNKEAGIPLVRCPKWDGAGVGYHIQFGAPGAWTPVAKSCPGPKRVAQFERVLVPWMKAPVAVAPKPTAVQEARARLSVAYANAVKNNRPRRAAAVKAALALLPKR